MGLVGKLIMFIDHHPYNVEIWCTRMSRFSNHDNDFVVSGNNVFLTVKTLSLVDFFNEKMQRASDQNI